MAAAELTRRLRRRPRACNLRTEFLIEEVVQCPRRRVDTGDRSVGDERSRPQNQTNGKLKSPAVRRHKPVSLVETPQSRETDEKSDIMLQRPPECKIECRGRL